ncbi:MAG: septation regulator SpoVG [Proteocatella sp.]|jgi:stage V sporulation protein G|nr:septation regulator SpoVG [Proteocatella sp.]MBP7908096.1 septation regulator SpoVG [Proteocatella sp.]MBP8654721.1 septation regulator SpoVG [Proteocatella sp.]MBP9658443.1 septation regulator SpoVG [Proteocatella sp.]
MQITDVRVRKLSEEGKMRGIVSVTFDNAFVVHDIKIIEGQNGLFIAMPSRKVSEGEFRDIAHPINAEMRHELQDEILKAYEEAREKATEMDFDGSDNDYITQE